MNCKWRQTKAPQTDNTLTAGRQNTGPGRLRRYHSQL